ncbi:MAG: nicotinamide-nucleotide amidohydrolase family protein, partial [Pseudomonadota bacterium]
DRSFITYSNDAKMEMLGVGQDVIGRYGAVSGETARAMADGALRNSNATLAVAITGVAGPGGGTPDKPVGLVWFGLASKNGSVGTERRLFPKGDRDFVRQRATTTALMLLHQAIEPLKG